MADYFQRNGVLVPESAMRNGEAAQFRNRLQDGLRQFPELPGGGQPIVESFEMFVARYQSTTQDYLNPDVAYRFDNTLQRAMIQDPVVMEPLSDRMESVALLDWAVKPEDDEDDEQKAAAKIVEKVVRSTPYFLKMKMALLWALWYGRAGAELVYRWNRDPQKTYGERLKELKSGVPDKILEVRGWTPVHGDKIKFHQSTGDFGVYVNSRKLASDRNTGRGHEAMVRWLRGREAERWIVHRHEIVDADYFEPEKAGSISGVGLRERVWWPWWFKQLALQWAMQWLERLGMGFTIFYFEQDNSASEAKVRDAANKFHGGSQILFPRGGDGKTRGPGIERIEANTAGGQFILQLIDDYFGGQVHRMIARQTLTSRTGSTGLGSNVAEQHAETKSDICRFDAINLDETLTHGFIAVIQRYCFPKLRGKLRYESVLEKENPEAIMSAGEKLFNWGAELPEDHMREVVGIPKPKKGEKTLSKAKAEPQQPGAGAMPGGGMGGDPADDPIAALFGDDAHGGNDFGAGEEQPEAEPAGATT